MDKLYTTKEAAKYLRVHFRTIYALIKRGELKSKKIGQKYLFKESDLEKILNGTNNSRKAVINND